MLINLLTAYLFFHLIQEFYKVGSVNIAEAVKTQKGPETHPQITQLGADGSSVQIRQLGSKASLEFSQQQE